MSAQESATWDERWSGANCKAVLRKVIIVCRAALLLRQVSPIRSLGSTHACIPLIYMFNTRQRDRMHTCSRSKTQTAPAQNARTHPRIAEERDNVKSGQLPRTRDPLRYSLKL